MCNAANHPPGCNCGWGGVWYGNVPIGGGGERGSDAYQRKIVRPRQFGEQRGTQQAIASGFTNPNATCPVCGDSVYYYESPYGGKVFFDELGPPWPKHFCTTQEQYAHAGPIKGDHKPWNEDQWKSLSSAAVLPTPDCGDVYTLRGHHQGKTLNWFFAAESIVMAEIIRFKPRETGEFYLSILDFDTTTVGWQTWSGIAYTTAQRAATGVGKLQRTLLPPDLDAETLRRTATMRICPMCDSSVRKDRLISHLHKVHQWAI